MKYNVSKIFVLVLSSLAVASGLRAANPTAADVGDAETFGHNVEYMGAASGFVTLSTACTPTPTPSPPATANDSQCFVLNPAPANTSFVADDIARIKLPKKASRNVIYPALNFFINYQLQNSTGSPQPQGLFSFLASLTIESDVLNDPSIIDPGTGLPANGKLTFEFTYSFRDDRTMQDGDRQRIRETLVRVGNTGLTKAQFVAQGLTQSQADDLFKSAITVRMSVQGNVKLCTDATITGNMRLFGD